MIVVRTVVPPPLNGRPQNLEFSYVFLAPVYIVD